jgi:hypothetical protein
MRRFGGLGVTKRGDLRLLEPRNPGTGALFFCGAHLPESALGDGACRWHRGSEQAEQTLQRQLRALAATSLVRGKFTEDYGLPTNER